MKRTLYIHIGWHKTATTLIQQYLHDNREKLKEFDICYPIIHDQHDLIKSKHSYFFVSVLNRLELSDRKKEVSICDFDTQVAMSVDEIRASGCSKAILSEEELSRNDRGISKLMAVYRKHFDEVKVVAYLRRQDSFLESLYSQFIKQKPPRNSIMLKEYLNLNEVRQRADYAMILGWWAEEFGKENILVAPFEPEIMQPDPLAFFLKLTDLSTSIFDTYPPEKRTFHTSPPREVTEYLRHLNDNNIDFNENYFIDFLMKSGGDLTNAKYLDQKDRMALLKCYETSNKEVAREYLQREDGVLFRQPVIEHDNCQKTWEGMALEDLWAYALPASGAMSVELARMYKENQKLREVNALLATDNRRLGNIRKTLYYFLQNRYRNFVTRMRKDRKNFQ